MLRFVRKASLWIGGVVGFVLFANLVYYVKSEMGIKLTNQPHHGWLFPIADKFMRSYDNTPVAHTSGKLHYP